MPQLNIKNERAHELASRLSRLSGKSMSECIVDALEEKLDRERRLKGQFDREAEVERVVRRFDARAAKDPRPTGEIVDDLYDEAGAPR